MPRVAVPTTTSTSKGALLAAEANGDATNNHYLQNSGRERFIARNSGAGARTVTLLFNKTVEGQAITSYVKSIPAGESWVFGPFDVENYGTQVSINVEHAEVKLRAIA